MGTHESRDGGESRDYKWGCCDVVELELWIKEGRDAPSECEKPPDCQQLITLGFAIINCFSAERPTLTTTEISELLDLPEKEVRRRAERLADLHYLEVDRSGGESYWTLIHNEW
jgi:hypothetical protein